MIKYRCKTCLGEYYDTDKNLVAYYHACPTELGEDEEYHEREDKRDENASVKLEGLGRQKI